MHEYVQKSTSTTWPFSPAMVSGWSPGVLSHLVMPAKAGAGPQSASTGLDGVQSDRAPPVRAPVTPARACLAEALASMWVCRSSV